MVVWEYSWEFEEDQEYQQGEYHAKWLDKCEGKLGELWENRLQNLLYS